MHSFAYITSNDPLWSSCIFAQAAIEELRAKVKSGQQRMSLNLAFWCEVELEVVYND
jgi:hypothetical protein